MDDLFGFAMIGFIFFEFIFIALFIAWTNGLAEIKARIKGSPLLNIYRRDRTRQTVTCSMEAAMAKTAKMGDFIITPDSVYRDKKTGLPVLSAFADYGTTTDPRMNMAVSNFKKNGVENYGQAEAVNAALNKEGKELATDIRYMETIRFHDIIGFFKYNVNPNFIRSSVERRVYISLQGVKQLPLGWISMMAVLFIAGAIAYYIITTAHPGGAGGTVIPKVFG